MMSDTQILVEIHEKVGEIRGDVKGLAERAEKQDLLYDKLEKRVSGLEGNANRAIGAAAVIGAGVSAAVAYISKLILGHGP
jgi:hypothetical protein